MKQARLAVGWLKQKSKLLPVLSVILLLSSMTLPIFVEYASAATAGNGGAGTIDATWSGSFKTLTYKGKSFTGPQNLDVGNNSVAKGFVNNQKSGGTCGGRIIFVADYKTATTARYQENKSVNGVCTGYNNSTPTVISVDPSTGGSGDNASNTDNEGGSTDDIPPCERQGLSLGWVVCSLIDLLAQGTQLMQKAIDHLMIIDVKETFDTTTTSGKSYYAAWNSFRLFGIAFIIIAGLVMVISQALGFEVFDAYTVRKVVPRLFVAAIGISLSWWLMKFMVEITNDIGIGIRNIIYYPFRGMVGDSGFIGFGQSLLILMGGAAAYAFLGIAGIFSLVGTAALAALIAFVVLIIRQVVITFLILLAPIAIACYVLPNTQKAYNLWWDSLSKGLMMFPIISGFIAAGKVFSVVAASNVDGDFNLSQMIAIIAFFLPYFALPFTFRLAGGAIATLGGLTNDRSRGGFDRLRKYRGAKMAENAHAMKAGNRWKGDNKVSNALNASTRNTANLANAGMVPWKMRSRMQGAGAIHGQQELAEYMEKNAAFAAIKGNDDYLQATMKNMGGGNTESDWRRYLQGKGYSGRSLEQGVAQIRAAKRDVSNEVFEKAAVMANPSTGTGWKEGGVTQMMESINEVAGDDRHTAASMLAQMRNMASQAGRLDLAGSGFGTHIGQLERMYDEKKSKGTVSAATLTDVKHKIHANLLETKGANEFARARGQAVQQIAPEMLYDLQQAHAKVGGFAVGTTDRRNAERELAQKYASIANFHDSLNHMSPENAKLIADGLLSQKVYAGDSMDVMGRINEYRRTLNPDYVATRKDYDARQYREQGGGPPDQE